jgi:hypothetical protein
MKKVLLSTFAVLTFTAVSAQRKTTPKVAETEKEIEQTTTTSSASPSIQSSKGEEYLPKQGDWAIGFNANSVFKNLARAFDASAATPAQGDIYLTEGAFVGKLFISDNQAYRVVVNLGYGSNTTTNTTSTGTALPRTETEEKIKVGQFDIQLGVGKEWRRGKTRLQGFYGADALIGFNTGKDSETTKSSTTTAVGGAVNSSNTGINTNLGSTFTIGINGFIGAEYFILPKMALGVQYNWGLGVAFTGKGTTTTSATGAPDVETEASGANTSFFLGTRNGNNPGVGTASLNLTLHF